MFFYPSRTTVGEDPKSIGQANHIADIGFGDERNEKKIDIHQQLHFLIDNSPQLVSTDAQLVLLDTYESVFGIHDHRSQNASPLSLVSYNWAEDSCITSTLYERIKQFEERKVYSRFGLSLIEFLDLPHDICQHILDLSFNRTVSEGKIAESLSNQLDGILPNGKQR